METKELDAELQRMKGEKAAFEAFFYQALHDLKSPLRAISNLAQWIEEDLATEAKSETPEHLRLLRLRAESMTSLLNALVERFRASQ